MVVSIVSVSRVGASIGRGGVVSSIIVLSMVGLVVSSEALGEEVDEPVVKNAVDSTDVTHA